jgi:flagellar biosynthesis anti-sigma factor FlgM
MEKKKNTAKLLRYKEMAKGIPEVRQEKVDEIKKKIEAGKYKVDAEAIAKKMLELTQDVNNVTHQKKSCK